MTTDQRAYNQQMIDDFRAARDTPDGPFPGRALTLLTTTGAKSGLKRTTPLMYATIDDTMVLIGSNMGAPTTPDWCRNMLAHPQVGIEVGKERYEATATLAGPADRGRLWAALLEQSPFFADHQAKTEREIPLFTIERRV